MGDDIKLLAAMRNGFAVYRNAKGSRARCTAAKRRIYAAGWALPVFVTREGFKPVEFATGPAASGRNGVSHHRVPGAHAREHRATRR